MKPYSINAIDEFYFCTDTILLIEAEKNRILHYFREVARNAEKGNSFKVWKDGSHAEAIISDDFILQKLNYIHENPVRKGYVDRPEYWTYSSARNYILNDQSIIQLQLLE